MLKEECLQRIACEIVCIHGSPDRQQDAHMSLHAAALIVTVAALAGMLI